MSHITHLARNRSRPSFLASAAIFVALAVPAAAASPAAADQAPQSCRGEVVSSAVQFFQGRRTVAATFFGDYPQAVQDAERFLQEVICA